MAGYKMKVVKSQYGPQGVATIALSEDGKKVRLLMRPEEGDEEKPKPIILDRDNCPDYVRKGKWYVRLSADKKKLYSTVPLNGVFNSNGSHVTLRHAKDEKPSPKTDNFGNLVFQVDIEITSGDCKGMSASYNYSGLHYNFIPIEDEGKQVVGIKGKGSYTKQLIEFCSVLGIEDKGPIAWRDNILPVLQKRIMSLDRPFQFIIKSEEKTTKAGEVITLVYIDGLIPMDNSDGDDNDDNTEPEPAQTKSKMKPSKKPTKDEDDELPWDKDEPDDVEDDDDDTEDDDGFDSEDIPF